MQRERERKTEWCVVDVDIRTYICIIEKRKSLHHSIRSFVRSSFSLAFFTYFFFFLALFSRLSLVLLSSSILEPQYFLSVPCLPIFFSPSLALLIFEWDGRCQQSALMGRGTLSTTMCWILHLSFDEEAENVHVRMVRPYFGSTDLPPPSLLLLLLLGASVAQRWM